MMGILLAWLKILSYGQSVRISLKVSKQHFLTQWKTSDTCIP